MSRNKPAYLMNRYKRSTYKYQSRLKFRSVPLPGVAVVSAATFERSATTYRSIDIDDAESSSHHGKNAFQMGFFIPADMALPGSEENACI